MRDRWLFAAFVGGLALSGLSYGYSFTNHGELFRGLPIAYLEDGAFDPIGWFVDFLVFWGALILCLKAVRVIGRKS